MPLYWRRLQEVITTSGWMNGSKDIHHITFTFTYPLTTIWGSLGITDDFTTSFPFFSVHHCPLGLYIPWCCLLTSSSVWLVFFPLSSRFARWFWPDLMNGRHVHTTSVCVFLRWSGGLRVVSLPAGSWHTSLTPINLHLLGITDTSDQKIKISRWTRWTISSNVQILQPGWQC